MEGLIKNNEEKKQHEKFMKMAIELSNRGVTRGCGPFGCVIINAETKDVIGSGHNQVLLHSDPTLHAEMVAIKDACHYKNSHILENTIMYTSCEPCPMCYSAICWAHIPTVFYGNTQGDGELHDIFVYKEIKPDWTTPPYT